MKSFIKIAFISLPLSMASPSFSQIIWGADLHFGAPPPPREVIIERPYPGAIWVRGRWHPRYWIPPGHRYGWNRRRDWDRDMDWDRGRNDRRWDRRDEERGRGDEHRSEGRGR